MPHIEGYHLVDWVGLLLGAASVIGALILQMVARPLLAKRRGLASPDQICEWWYAAGLFVIGVVLLLLHLEVLLPAAPWGIRADTHLRFWALLLIITMLAIVAHRIYRTLPTGEIKSDGE